MKLLPALATALTVAVLTGCGDEPKPEATAKPVLKPEMIVTPVRGQFLAACHSEDLLKEALLHSVREEKTKFAAMFSNMDCVQIPYDGRYKVLSVGHNVIEITTATASDSRGMWTVTEAMQPEK